jgi:hypothetical protein
MDNILNHSILREIYSKSNWEKVDAQQWLKNKKLSSTHWKLSELWQKVKNLLPHEKKYELDELVVRPTTVNIIL